LAIFQQRWPQVFAEDLRQYKPLALGIHQEIIPALPEVKPWRIRQTIALFQRGGRDAYWRAIVKGGPRYNLDGTPNGEVTVEEQDKARQDLKAIAVWCKARHEGHLKTPSSLGADDKDVPLSPEEGTSAG
jgi:sRNA-binding protein